VPEWLHARFAPHADDADAHRQAAEQTAIEQVTALQRHGVDELHFYTLNRAELTLAVCRALDIEPTQESAVG
jgi:methylenetetrahydrofolate reductase (NADPH)